jgi:hypothetical protein
MSSIVFLMDVKRRRREIGIVTLVAQSVMLPFAPRCGYLEGLAGLLVAGLVSLETGSCMLTMIAGVFLGELFLTSLFVDWCASRSVAAGE